MIGYKFWTCSNHQVKKKTSSWVDSLTPKWPKLPKQLFGILIGLDETLNFLNFWVKSIA